MADEETSKNGVWIDTRTGKIVDGKQPEESIQLVAAGGVIDNAVKAAIQAAKDAEAGTGSDDKTVTTEKTGSRTRSAG